MSRVSVDQTSRYVRDLLEVAGYAEGGDGVRVRTLLHHLYVAVALFETSTAGERAEVEAMRRKLRYFFSTDVRLKERKRKKTEKENPSPTPPLREKEKEKEIEEKNRVRAGRASDGGLDVRRAAFRQECLAFVGRYDNELLADFFNYWSEESSHAGRMRFEVQRFWNTEKRISRWMNNQYSSETTAAAIRLRKAKRQAAEAEAARQQQQQAAREREARQQEREAEGEAARQGSITLEEYAARNPAGALARLARARQRKGGAP